MISPGEAELGDRFISPWPQCNCQLPPPNRSSSSSNLAVWLRAGTNTASLGVTWNSPEQSTCIFPHLLSNLVWLGYICSEPAVDDAGAGNYGLCGSSGPRVPNANAAEFQGLGPGRIHLHHLCHHHRRREEGAGSAPELEAPQEAIWQHAHDLLRTLDWAGGVIVLSQGPRRPHGRMDGRKDRRSHILWSLPGGPAGPVGPSWQTTQCKAVNKSSGGVGGVVKTPAQHTTPHHTDGCQAGRLAGWQAGSEARKARS